MTDIRFNWTRAEIATLATLPRHPESVPVKGAVLGDILADAPMAKIDDIEFVRVVASARIMMPLSMVRLSAGRESTSDEPMRAANESEF